MTTYETLETERDGAVLRVFLNRPERLNALNTTLLEELEALFTATQRDFETRVVVLGGRGRAFSSGADLAAPPARTEREVGARERRWLGQLGLRATRAIQDVEATTIARVQGYAVGGGFVLALACDFRIAAEDAVFHVPEVDHGVPLTWGATPRLIDEIGAARARQLILMCDRIDGAQAERWGVVHSAVPAEHLDEAVDEWTKRLLAKPEHAVHTTKTQFRAYTARGRQGDVTETDGDLLTGVRLADPRGRPRS